MADIRCPHCGKITPDFLDVCQFCQNPLKTESKLSLGEKPTKKNTGELENVLPDWLKDVRQQARASAEEEAVQAASTPRSTKDEPPDLLAGLASQANNAEDEDIPDWLASLSGTKKPEKPAPPAPETDFFAQFNKKEPAPSSEPIRTPEPPAPLEDPAPKSSEEDELSAWFSRASEEPVEPASPEPGLSDLGSGWDIRSEPTPAPETPAKEQEDLSWLHNLEAQSRKTGELSKPKEDDWFAELSSSATAPASGQDDLSWLNDLGGVPAPSEPAPQPSQAQEDLSWLNDLGGFPASEAPVQKPSKAKEDLSWLNDFEGVPSAQEPQRSPVSKEDLSWLNDLGAVPAASEPAQPPSESAEDLSWLNNLGGTPMPSEPAQQPAESKDDLSWLNNLGGVPVPEQPAQPQEDLSWLNAFGENQPPAATPAAQDDLSWLNELGTSPAAQPSDRAPESPAFEPSSSQNDLSWLNDLQGSDESLSAAPFAEPTFDVDQPKSGDEQAEVPHVAPFTPRRTAPLTPAEDESMPDWLRSATEGPSMPINAGQLDQFREDFVPAAPEEPFSWKNFVPEAKMDAEERTLPVPASDPSPTLSNQDVDSLFSVDMPDWLSQAAPEETAKPAQDIGVHAEGGEALAPVDLPSWVQAMRPVEAVIAETPSVEDQPTEREGPLRGFKGVLPVIPIGSARRPQPIPLKLQASDEQQASAAILEQLLASETSPRAVISAPAFASQRMLRIGIAVLLWLVLGAVIFLRTQIMPVSTVVPVNVTAASRALDFIPDSSSVLVVMDYEPSLAGEMEATSGPLLNDLIQRRHPNLSFITTSTNGFGLVERLVRNTNVSTSLGYIEGQNYFNLGYLPGGESGIISFLQSPHGAIPAMSGNMPAVFSGYSAVILLTDHADSARAWVEQLQAAKQSDPTITNQPLLVVSSAQAGPMLQPYVGSRQINGMVNGLADAARYEASRNTPGTARSYWDAFGAGVMLAVVLILLGSLWSIIATIRDRRVEAGEA